MAFPGCGSSLCLYCHRKTTTQNRNDMSNSNTDQNTEFPINLGNIRNAAEAPFTVSVPSLTLDVGERGDLVAVPFTPEPGCDPSQMLRLQFQYLDQDQELFISYSFDASIEPSFLLKQVDNNGECRESPITGVYSDGDIDITITDDGGVLIIGTVVIDVEEKK